MLIGIVIVPFAFCVLTIPLWVQGMHAADAAAAEAGRAFVLSGGDPDAVARAIRLVEAGRGLAPGTLELVSARPAAARQADIDIEVAVRLPAVAFFDVGAFTYTAGHTERYPTYVGNRR